MHLAAFVIGPGLWARLGREKGWVGMGVGVGVGGGEKEMEGGAGQSSSAPAGRHLLRFLPPAPAPLRSAPYRPAPDGWTDGRRAWPDRAHARTHAPTHSESRTHARARAPALARPKSPPLREPGRAPQRVPRRVDLDHPSLFFRPFSSERFSILVLVIRVRPIRVHVDPGLTRTSGCESVSGPWRALAESSPSPFRVLSKSFPCPSLRTLTYIRVSRGGWLQGLNASRRPGVAEA